MFGDNYYGYLTPTFRLIIFLIVASYHFGKEDTQFLINENSYFNQLLFFLKGLLDNSCANVFSL